MERIAFKDGAHPELQDSLGDFMNKKSFMIGLASYVIWGILPVYWHALDGVDSLLILANRILWSAVFTVALMKATGKLQLLKDAFKSKETMKYMIPAAFVITLNWGLYIWSIGSAHLLDSSFGYYIEPLIVSLFGIVFFRERCTKMQIIAFAFAIIGVAYFTIRLGRMPMLSLGIAMSFAVYGALKKKVHIDPTAGIAIETLIVSPLALVYIIYSFASGTTGITAPVLHPVLLVLAGVVTAAPLILFASGVNDLPLYIMGFLQYISPTLQMVIGLFYGEKLTTDQMICFVLIWIGFGIFSASLIKESKKEQTKIS